jgi:hypothetical protein
MCLAKTDDIHLELAVDVFKSQNPALIISLKNFLTVLPNPQCVEDVLTAAIYTLAKTEPEACRWILRNSYYLKPEVDLVEFTSNLALTKLQNRGFVLNQDFKFEPNSHLQVTEKAKAGLMADNSDGDRLLLEEILQICDATPAL